MATVVGCDVEQSLNILTVPFIRDVMMLRHKDIMQIFAKTLDGKMTEFEVEDHTTVADLKSTISLAKYGRMERRLYIVHAGRSAEDTVTMKDWGVHEGSVIHVVINLRGGGNASIAIDLLHGACRSSSVITAEAGTASWRCISAGFNTVWECGCCTEYNRHHRYGQFDALKMSAPTCECPRCGKTGKFRLVRMIFNNCAVKIVARKINGNDEETREFNVESDKTREFDKAVSGVDSFESLTVFVDRLN